MSGPIRVPLPGGPEVFQLDKLCPTCKASGDPCRMCHRTGYVLTETGKALAAFVRRHVTGQS